MSAIQHHQSKISKNHQVILSETTSQVKTKYYNNNVLLVDQFVANLKT